MNKMTMFQLNEKYKNYPAQICETIIDGKKYRVTAHFVGNKDLDNIIRNLALERALRETLNAA